MATRTRTIAARLTGTGQRSEISTLRSQHGIDKKLFSFACLLSSGAETGSACKLKNQRIYCAVRVCRMMQPVVEDNLLPPTDLRPRENTANHNCTIKLTFKLKSSFVCVIYSIPPMRIDTKPMNKQNHTTMGEWTASRLDCKWCSVFLKWMREKRIDLNIQKSFDERLSTYSASIDPIHIQHKHLFWSRTQSTHWPGPIFICIIGWTSSDCVDNLNDIVLVLQILMEKNLP